MSVVTETPSTDTCTMDCEAHSVRRDLGAFTAIQYAIARLLLLASNRSVLALVDQAVVSGTMFVTSVVIGRNCYREDLGIYALALNLIYFVRGVQEQVISAPYMVYSQRRDADDLARYTGSTLSHQLLLCVILSVVLLSRALGLNWGVGPVGRPGLAWVLAIVTPLVLLREYMRQLAFARFEVRTAVLLDVTACVVQMLGLIVLVNTSHVTIRAVFGVMGLASLMACIVYICLRRPVVHVNRRAIWSDWWFNWSFGKWALASQLTANTTPFVLPWMVALSHGDAATGTMAACCTLVGLAGMFVSGMSNFNAPRIAQAYARGGVRDLMRQTRWSTGVFAVCLGSFAVATLFGGEAMIQLVYGSKFSGVSVPMAVLAFGIFANSVGIPAGNALWAMERPRANFVADLSNLIVTFVMAGLLICEHGVVGATVAMLMGYLAGSSMRWLTLMGALRSIRRASETVATDAGLDGHRDCNLETEALPL